MTMRPTKQRMNGKLSATIGPEVLGSAIVMKGGQISKVHDKLFLVKPQSIALASKVPYKVKWKKNRWTCQCPGFAHKRRSCEHIHAVNILLKLPQLIMSNLDGLEGACPECGSNDIIMKGFRYNKNGYVHLFLCKNCGKKFKNPVSRENLISNISVLLIVFDLYFKKLSLAEIKSHLWQIYGIEKATSTLYDWITRFGEIVRRATNRIKINGGKKILIDEMAVKVNGKKHYLWNVLDFKTRYYLVSILTQGRGVKDASKVIENAIDKMGGTPKQVVTDGLQSYCSPLKKLGITHIANVGLAKYQNNNRIERLNGTVRSFARAKRGMKNRAGEMLETHRVYYNHIRTHSSLRNSTPSGAKNPRWLSLFSSTRRKMRRN